MRFDSIRSFFVNVVRRATSESVPGGNRAVRNRPRSRSLALESLETRELLCAVSSSLLEISAAELVGDSVVAAAATVAAPERLDNAVANDRYDIVYSLREEGVVRVLGQTGVQNYSSMSYCAITDPIYLELWEKAIERWENVISEDLADITYPYAVDGVTDMRIDDLYLDLGFSASFSSSSTLGSALNAGFYRDAGRGTAATGSLVFNAKYFVANPSSTVQTVFYNTALHEIAHTLGYNIAHFDKVGLLESSRETPYALDDLFDSGSSYYYYVGEKGVELYRQAFPAAMINQSTTPDKFVMETYTANGSFGAHPSSILATYNLHLNQRDGVNYAISSLFEGTITTTTLGVMEDLGYTVDYNFADALGSPVPENLTAKTVGEEVALNWNKAAGDLSNADSGPARYQIERIDANELDGSGQEDGWRVIATDVEETTYRDATVEPGREYVYRVRASYIRTNKEIDVFRAMAGQQLSWDSDETKFTIYALVNKGANAVGWDRVVASTSNKSWTATSLSSKPGAGATLFRVVAVGAILDSTGPSRAARVNVVAVPKTLDAPTCKSSASTSDSVTIAWDHVANASGYVVEYKSADDPGYTVMPITNDATMTITNLAPETTYKLRLYAVGDGINFVDSPYSPVKAVKTKVAPVVPVDAVPLDAPTWKSSSSTANSVTVAWNHVANASGYVVEYKSANDASYTVMPITNDATVTITNLAPETTYKLRLYAVGDAINYANSPYSSVKAVKTKVAPVVPDDAVPLDVPTWKSSSSTANSVTVAWSPVANASGYVVEYKSANDASYTVMPITNDATITITNLAPETTYKLRLYAVGDAIDYANSPYSSVKAVKTKVAPVAPAPLTAPTFASTSSTANSVTIAWRPVANASGYVVEYKGPADPAFVAIPQTTATTATIDNLVADSTYEVRVYAVGDGAFYSNSDPSAVEAVRTLAASADVPSTVVTSLADTIDANDGLITLREAITVYANEGDAVTFAPTLKGGTIALSGSQIVIDKAITVSARALWDKTDGVPGITIDANSASRIFRITGDTVWLDSLAFTGGNGGGAGGAIYAYQSTLTISNAAFSGNTGTYGGAVYADASTLAISNSSFRNNTVEGEGGGAAINAYRSTLAVANSSFRDNTAYYGGAIYASYSTATISNASFCNNAASGLGGGAIGAQISTLDVSNSSFQNNTGTYGGAFDVSSSALTLSNSILVQNAALNASALYLTSANARVFNATIYDNVASGAGSNRAIYASANTHLDLHNSIVAGNSGADVYKADVRSVVSAYNVLSGYAGWTNADAIVFAYDPSKPLFADAAQGDYALARGSQAIDKGDDVYVYAEKDLAGNARINFEAVDLGAYEYGTMLEAPKIKSSSATRNSVTVAWNAIANAAGYVVAYKSSTDSFYIETPTTTSTTYTLVNLDSATEYKVKILARGDGTDYADSPYGPVKAVRTKETTASALLDDAFADFSDDALFDEF